MNSEKNIYIHIYTQVAGCCLPFPGGDVDLTLTLLTLPGGDGVPDNGWLPSGGVVGNMDTASIGPGEE